MHMNPNQFKKYLRQVQTHLEQYLRTNAPDVVGTEAVNFFNDSFHNEGFTDRTLKKWDDVKRRVNARDGDRKAHTRYKILSSHRNNLSESLTYKKQNNSATITTDVPYADAHNQGTNRAGRNQNVKIPRRQFVGPSHKLNQTIVKELSKDIKNIFSQK